MCSMCGGMIRGCGSGGWNKTMPSTAVLQYRLDYILNLQNFCIEIAWPDRPRLSLLV